MLWHAARALLVGTEALLAAACVMSLRHKQVMVCNSLCEAMYCASAAPAACPAAVLRAPGFPGESDEAHRELVDFAREFRFERAGAFAYSEEDGTPAAELPEQVPQRVRCVAGAACALRQGLGWVAGWAAVQLAGTAWRCSCCLEFSPSRVVSCAALALCVDFTLPLLYVLMPNCDCGHVLRHAAHDA